MLPRHSTRCLVPTTSIPGFVEPHWHGIDLAIVTPLFDFDREAIAAELSSSTNDEYLLNLEVAWTDRPPSVPTFVPVHSVHPASRLLPRNSVFPIRKAWRFPLMS